MPITPPTFGFQALATSTALNASIGPSGVLTAEINRIGGFLPGGTAAGAATAAGTPATIPLRDANGGFTVSGLNVIVNNTSGGIGMTGIASQTAGYVNILASDATTVFNLAASKAATFGSSVTVQASGISVTGASSIAGNLTVTGATSIVTVPAILAAAPSVSVVPLILRAFDTTPRKLVQLQDSSQTTQDNGSLWSDGTSFFKAETWTQYAGFMSSSFLFAAFVYPANPASLVVNVAPGSVWNGNTWIENPGGGSVTYTAAGGAPLQLPAANPRIDIIGFNASNVIAVVNGVENASPVPPALPAAFTPLAYIKVRPGATQIQALGTTDTGTQSYIYRDIRANYVNPTGLGASGSFAPLTPTYITDADETGGPGLVNAKRLGLILAKAQTVSGPLGVAGPFGGPDLIRTGWTSSTVFDAALSTMMKNRVSYNLQSNPQKYLNKQSAAVMQLIGNGAGDNIAVDANGSWRVINTVLTVTISGTAGAKCVYADCTGNGPGFTLGFAASAPSANSGQIPLCWIYWDGATIQDAMVDYSPLGVYTLFNDSANRQYGPYTVQPAAGATSTAFNAANTLTAMTGFGDTTLYFPRKCNVLMSGSIRVTNGSAPTSISIVYMQVTLNGGAFGAPNNSQTLAATGTEDKTLNMPDQLYIAPAGSTAAFGVRGVLQSPGGLAGNALPVMIVADYTIKVY